MAAQYVCQHNKFGFCKYQEKCMHTHIDDLCDEFDCDATVCDRRHPKECRYFRIYKRCKFDPCKFSHIDKVSESLDQIQKLKDNIYVKIAEIDDKIHKLNNQMKTIENKQKEVYPTENDFLEKIENKFAIFENNLEILKKAVFEKDSYIITLEDKLSKIVEENKEQEKKIEKLGQQVKVMSDSSLSAKSVFKCRNCDFETNSEKGLKQHTSKKHTKSEDKGRTVFCEYCKHAFNNNETLAVHIGKNHTDNFKCGLCERFFETKENLEVHLNTCEVYQCTKCKKKELTMSDSKEHIIKDHDSENYIMVDNFKLSRENWEDVTWRNFYFKF